MGFSLLRAAPRCSSLLGLIFHCDKHFNGKQGKLVSERPWFPGRALLLGTLTGINISEEYAVTRIDQEPIEKSEKLVFVSEP